jgi:hypothetical protein
MHNDDITISEFGEAADDVMTELAAAGLHGMSTAQADLVVRMGKLLDFAARKFSAAIEAGGCDLTARAANHALAMRIHGATLRGVSGAEMLEDLCDAVLGRYIADPAPVKKPKPILAPDPVPPGCLSVEQAMTMLGINRFAQLARSIGTSASMITLWRNQGYLPPKKTKIVRDLVSATAMQEAA